MTSTSWPDGVNGIAEEYMVGPVTVIRSLDLAAAVHSVSQKDRRLSSAGTMINGTSF